MRYRHAAPTTEPLQMAYGVWRFSWPGIPPNEVLINGSVNCVGLVHCAISVNWGRSLDISGNRNFVDKFGYHILQKSINCVRSSVSEWVEGSDVFLSGQIKVVWEEECGKMWLGMGWDARQLNASIDIWGRRRKVGNVQWKRLMAKRWEHKWDNWSRLWSRVFGSEETGENDLEDTVKGIKFSKWRNGLEYRKF